MMNVVCLIGRLVAQPELKYTSGSNIAVCSFRIAVDRRFKDQSGQKMTDFIDIVAWRQNAEFVANYGDKGRLISVTGTLQVRSWQAQDGSPRKTVEVVADSIQTLDRRPSQNGDAYGQAPIPAVAPPDPFGATDGIPNWGDYSQTAQNTQNSNKVEGVDYDPFSDE